MNTHMVEEAGTRFFELASSLGRIHAETLSGLADATAKTPLGAVFAVNASLAHMANNSMETLASRLSAKNAPTAKAPAKTPASKPKKAKKAASVAGVEATMAIADAFEPDVADVLVDEGIDTTANASASIPKADGKPDDLTLISGVGATTAKKLNKAGIETFAQIVAMDESAFEALLASLDIKSIRFTPSFWIDEARKLST